MKHKNIGEMDDEELIAHTLTLRDTNDILTAALKDIARSNSFNGGTFVLELQHIAKEALKKARMK